MRGGGAPGDRGTARGFSGPASVRRPASALGGERRGGRGCLGRLLRVADASPRVVLGEPGAHRIGPRRRRRLGRNRRREDPAGGGPAPEAHGREAAASRPRAGRRVLGPALRLGRHQRLEAVPLLPAVDRAGRRAAASRRTDAGKTNASPARAPRAPARAPGGGVRRRGRRVRADRHRLRGRRARDVLRRGPGGARRASRLREDRLARTRAVGERVARVRALRACTCGASSASSTGRGWTSTTSTTSTAQPPAPTTPTTPTFRRSWRRRRANVFATRATISNRAMAVAPRLSKPSKTRLGAASETNGAWSAS